MSIFTRPARTYLDWASAAPVLPAASYACMVALSAFGNPSSPHHEGQKAKDILERSRTSIARSAGVKLSAVVFTSGATESNALAINGRYERCRAQEKGPADMHVLYLPTMHSSVLENVRALQSKGVAIEPIALTGTAVDIEAFAGQLRKNTILVCVDAVCGETGIRWETLKMRRAIDAAGYGGRAILHVDASQLPLVEPIERTRLGADMYTLDAQKVGGVRGIGALIVSKHDLISPITFGGGQEHGLRPGTEPIALASAFSTALEARAAGHERFAHASERMRMKLHARIANELSGIQVLEGKHQAPHIVNLQFPGIDTDYLVMLLNTAGFAVSTRSACETDSENGSSVVLALTGNAARAKSTLRISWGPSTQEATLMRFAKALILNVRFLEQSAI